MKIDLRFSPGDPRLAYALHHGPGGATRRRAQRLLVLMAKGLDPHAAPPRLRLPWPAQPSAGTVQRVRLTIPDTHVVARELARWSEATGGLPPTERALQLLERGLIAEDPARAGLPADARAVPLASEPGVVPVSSNVVKLHAPDIGALRFPLSGAPPAQSQAAVERAAPGARLEAPALDDLEAATAALFASVEAVQW
jgi:hypothetical protein